jgi:hypothetical protein
VNQPALNFASTTAGAGHFLAGAITCLLVALLVPGVIPRPSSMTAELGAIQLAWSAAVVGLGWIPLVDPWDGHLARLFLLRDIPTGWLWTMPLVAAGAVLPAVLRLLSLARSAEPQLHGPRRVGLVLAGLVLPTATHITGMVVLLSVVGWPETPLTGLGFLAADPRRALLGAAVPMIAAVIVASRTVPTVSAIRRCPTDGRSVLLVALLAVASALGIAVAGAPRTDGIVRSVLWGAPNARTNIRPWIERDVPPPKMVP